MRPVCCYCLVHPPIVLLISAKSLVLFKDYGKILKLAVDTGPGTDSSQTTSLLLCTVFCLTAKLVLASPSGEQSSLLLTDRRRAVLLGPASSPAECAVHRWQKSSSEKLELSGGKFPMSGCIENNAGNNKNIGQHSACPSVPGESVPRAAKHFMRLV